MRLVTKIRSRKNDQGAEWERHVQIESPTKKGPFVTVHSQWGKFHCLRANTRGVVGHSWIELRSIDDMMLLVSELQQAISDIKAGDGK